MTSVIASCKATVGCTCKTCDEVRAAIRRANDAKKKACSLCKARPGASCVKGLGGQRRPPHAERYAA
jgi:hypothetical protein